MFETFLFRGIFVSCSSLLSLYSSGKTTGVILESGEDLTTIIPFWEGNLIPHAIKRHSISGRDITLYLLKLLNYEGNSFSTSETDIWRVENIKEACCQLSLEKSYNEEYLFHADFEGVKVKLSRYKAPECLFKPELLQGEGEKGIHEIIFESIEDCHRSYQAKL